VLQPKPKERKEKKNKRRQQQQLFFRTIQYFSTSIHFRNRRNYIRTNNILVVGLKNKFFLLGFLDFFRQTIEGVCGVWCV